MQYLVEIHKTINSFKSKDWMSKNDLFVIITMGDEIRRTTVKWNDNSPTWDEKFLFDFNKINTSFINVAIYDEDKYSTSEKICDENIKIHLGKITNINSNFLNLSHGILNLELEKKNEELLKEVNILKSELCDTISDNDTLITANEENNVNLRIYKEKNSVLINEVDNIKKRVSNLSNENIILEKNIKRLQAKEKLNNTKITNILKNFTNSHTKLKNYVKDINTKI